ncbi:GH25 family lysozyme [Bacillus cereus]|uniref:N-acetylmuramoyl-L-alanine amidase n=1 Tax=Bacillus cereus VD184 TaxID=1053242 RepID=A0A9W5R283_BACCE|nr:GH25 family lysozyme [Bacillus cereus]EOQ05345.1 hypothetical protein IKC_06279 [Bacillus cereus VD184]
MGHIVDISKWNDKINWPIAAPQIELAICRVQYGSKLVDHLYNEHVSKLEQYGIPHAAYAYGCFVSVADAIVEAKDFLARVNPNATFLVLDVEDDTVKSMKSKGNLKDLATASQAFIDTCKAAGWKVGFYVAHHMYGDYDLQSVQADFIWLPRYGTNDGRPQKKPAYLCDIWQYTDKGYMDGIGEVDMNVLQGDKDLAWFTGYTRSAVAPDESKYIVTGGLGLEACTEISKYLLERKWWAKMEFTTNGDAFVQTGGIYEPQLSEFRMWMDGNGWWYEVR